MKRLLGVALLALVTAAGTTAWAHHSFAATYLDDREITIAGELVQFLFRNPHSFMHVLAPDKEGKVYRWAIEWNGGGQLGQQGITRDTLRPGDHVVVTGNPARAPGDHRLRLRSIFRPRDGWRWGGPVD